MEIDRKKLACWISLSLILSDMLVYLINARLVPAQMVKTVPMLVVAFLAMIIVWLLAMFIPELCPESELRFPVNLTLPTLSVAILVTISALIMTRSPSIATPYPLQIVAGQWQKPSLFLMSWVIKGIVVSGLLWARRRKSRSQTEVD